MVKVSNNVHVLVDLKRNTKLEKNLIRYNLTISQTNVFYIFSLVRLFWHSSDAPVSYYRPKTCM